LLARPTSRSGTIVFIQKVMKMSKAAM